jgi:hypothetical protein
VGVRKRTIGTRSTMILPLMPKQRWCLDSVVGRLSYGLRYQIWSLFDDCTRALAGSPKSIWHKP